MLRILRTSLDKTKSAFTDDVAPFGAVDDSMYWYLVMAAQQAESKRRHPSRLSSAGSTPEESKTV